MFGGDSKGNSTDNSTLPPCNYTSCGSSSISKELQTALAVSGGSAAVGVGGVLVLLAVIFACKRRYKRRKSYTPETGQGAPARRATTFRKRSMKGSQSGTPPAPTHNYETVLPNFSKKLPAEAAALAQNYETPLPKAATLPRDLSVCAGKDRTPPRIKFSQSVKVRGSTPEAVYMNVKETPTGEDVCAMNPWNHHKQWDRGFTHSQRGNGTMPDASNHQLMAEIEMGPISPGDPWENN